MKKIIVSTLAICVATAAHAVDLRQYFGVKVSDVFGNADVKDGGDITMREQFGLAAQYGVKLSDFRAELELAHYLKASPKGEDVDVSHTILFVNGYYDLATNSPFSPYATIGIGYNRILVDGDSDPSLAFKLGLGASWNINTNIALDLGYRYIRFGEYNDDHVDVTFSGHELSLGARFSF